MLRTASEVLRQAGKPDHIDGYHAGSRQRVWEVASAIYTAIANLGLSYALPPASFEDQGQKVRLPGRTLDGGVATCLDSAVLFAAVFEQAGFNPIIALPKEHAMVGLWLQPEELATVVVDEAEVLRKRIDLDELLLLETTAATSSPAPALPSTSPPVCRPHCRPKTRPGAARPGACCAASCRSSGATRRCVRCSRKRRRRLPSWRPVS